MTLGERRRGRVFRFESFASWDYLYVWPERPQYSTPRVVPTLPWVSARFASAAIVSSGLRSVKPIEKACMHRPKRKISEVAIKRLRGVMERRFSLAENQISDLGGVRYPLARKEMQDLLSLIK